MPGDARAPRPPRLPSELGVKEAAGLTHDDTFSEATLSAADWSDQHANGLQLETVRLVNVDLSASRVEKLKVTDGELTLAAISAGRPWSGASFAAATSPTSRA